MSNATKRISELSEIEGAALLEIRRLKSCTAYALRKQFRDSPTLEWRASAGTIYPIVKRFLSKEWIKASSIVGDNRKSELLSLTASGRKVLSDWATRLDRSISPGQDPFRLRAPYWMEFNGPERNKQFEELIDEIESRIKYLREYSACIGAEGRIRTDLEIELQKTRLRWLRKHHSA